MQLNISESALRIFTKNLKIKFTCVSNMKKYACKNMHKILTKNAIVNALNARHINAEKLA